MAGKRVVHGPSTDRRPPVWKAPRASAINLAASVATLVLFVVAVIAFVNSHPLIGLGCVGFIAAFVLGTICNPFAIGPPPVIAAYKREEVSFSYAVDPDDVRHHWVNTRQILRGTHGETLWYLTDYTWHGQGTTKASVVTAGHTMMEPECPDGERKRLAVYLGTPLVSNTPLEVGIHIECKVTELASVQPFLKARFDEPAAELILEVIFPTGGPEPAARATRQKGDDSPEAIGVLSDTHRNAQVLRVGHPDVGVVYKLQWDWPAEWLQP